MSLEIKNAIDELGKQFSAFKDANDAELKRVNEKLDGASDEASLKNLEEMMSKSEKAIEDIQVAMQRESKQKLFNDANADKEVKKAVSNWMRDGKVSTEEEALIKSAFPEEMKALSVDNNPAGGYTVRPAVSNEISEKIFESSPIRQLADAEVISTDAWEELYDYGEPDSGWVGETEARTETNTANGLKMIRIPVHELYASPKLTQKIIDDSYIDIESWHQKKVIDKFGRQEASSFVTGDGVKKPKGFLSYAAGDGFDKIEQVNSGSAGALTADGLIDLQNALLEQFQANAKFLMKRSAAGLVRKLKDSQNRYLFSIDPAAALNGGQAFNLLGAGLVYADGMPAVTANALSVAYGDFKQGYKIIDRVGIRVIRDIYTSKGNVILYTTKRVGGGVHNFQAIKVQKISA